MAEAGVEAEAVRGIPFPPLKPDDTLADGAIGEAVLQTGPGTGLRPGTYAGGVMMRGFSADEQAPELLDGWVTQVATWQREGGFQWLRTTYKGLDAAPLALEQACAGNLKGVVLVELASRLSVCTD